MWKWACSLLGIKENASKDEIKKAYREKAKQYHPDSTKRDETGMQYIYIKNAYEYLISHDMPVEPSVRSYNRPAKVLGNDVVLNRQLQKQKEIERSKQKAKNWVPKESFKDIRKEEKNNSNKLPTEEEILNQIRALLLAEHIKRQIQSDKEKKLYIILLIFIIVKEMNIVYDVIYLLENVYNVIQIRDYLQQENV